MELHDGNGTMSKVLEPKCKTCIKELAKLPSKK